jgi:hypothetical protein
MKKGFASPSAYPAVVSLESPPDTDPQHGSFAFMV